jgi:hypothetical protein
LGNKIGQLYTVWAHLCGELLQLALRLHCLALCMRCLLHAAAQRSALPPVLTLQLSNTPLGSISWMGIKAAAAAAAAVNHMQSSQTCRLFSPSSSATRRLAASAGLKPTATVPAAAAAAAAVDYFQSSEHYAAWQHQLDH